VERYVEHQPDWRMDQEAAGRYCRRVGQDLLRLQSYLSREHAHRLGEAPLAMLQRVLKESFQYQQDQELLPKKKLEPGSLVNPHEPEAVMTRTRRRRWTGYKLQISESVPQATVQKGQPTEAFITAIHTQVSSEGDIKSLDAIREAEKRVGLETPSQRYVDSAYISGEQLRSEQEAGGNLVGPVGRCKVHPAEAEGFVIADDGQHATCPAGHANEHTRACNKTDRKTKGFRLVWAGCCVNCPRREGCLRPGASERHVETRIDFALLQQRRREQTTVAFQQEMHHRNAIEGTGSELVRAHGLRRARYRGRVKVHLGHLLIAAACNVKRWVKRMQYKLRECIAPATPEICPVTA
jgi:transposase